jgi:hypothetical protein
LIRYDYLVSKELYLRSISGNLPTRYSDQPGLQRRAAQLQRFLSDLQATLKEQVDLQGLELYPLGLELWVLSQRDWFRLSSRSYGLAFLRQKEVIAPADYNPRLIERFDAILLQAGQHGLKAPGEVRELFDLLIACEWAKGMLSALRLHTRRTKIDGFLAVYVFLLVLQPEDSLYQRFLAWAQILAVTQVKGPLKDLFFVGQYALAIKDPSWEWLGELQTTNDKQSVNSMIQKAQGT